jgi:mono/diheme cytochrome c family protein
MRQKSSRIIALSTAVAAAWGVPAQAKPVAPQDFCRIYPQTALCASGAAPCTTCHTTPPARNAYGLQVESALSPGTPRPLSDELFLSGLPAALRAAESLDADSDGTSNVEEFQAGTLHVDATSRPSRIVACDSEQRALASAQPWNTCDYDPAYALTRIGLDFCGQSATRGELDAVRGSNDWQMLLEQKLASCLDSAFWQGKDGVLWNLANAKILPESSLKSGDDAGDLTIADYEDDYNLFVYINTDDRDARELLTAKYHVLRQADGALVRIERTPVEDYLARDFDDGDIAQLVPQERRAGMLTTRWFLAKNTMVTPIPRTTAAQAYRAYLGYDIARMEGLQPVAGEPVDYDRKGVTAEQCAVCHSTLDPLSYPFSRYDGLGGGDEEEISNPEMAINADGTVNIAFGNYIADRLERFVRQEGPQIAETPEAGLLFGQPVADLVEWAEVAANSEPFARKVVLDYWRLLVGEDPQPSEEAEFATLAQRLSSEHEYRVERMLRDLVFTEAYGAP